MSTALTASTATTPAPWKAAFEADVGSMASPEFVLSTLQRQTSSSSSPSGSSSSSKLPFLPRARYCIYRGMWAELPANKHNDCPHNPPAYASDCPTLTTDVRMHKVADFFDTTNSAEGKSKDGSGGGGPVEAVWWCKDAGRQWRVRGTAWVVAQDVDEADSEGASSLRAQVTPRMRLHGGDGDGASKWSWARELRAHFGNVSPGMRGTFRNPPPGSEMNGDPDPDHQLGQKVGTDDELAFGNFRVVIIRPDEVESVDLNDPAHALRRLYRYNEHDGGGGSWKEQELWP